MPGNNQAKDPFLLQSRDLRVLSELAGMRVMDRELARLAGGFTDCNRIVNSRLLKLVRAGLLNRFFVGTTGAGRKAIYALSRKGADLLGSQPRLVSRRFGQTVVSDLFIEHQLQLNLIGAALKYRPLRVGVWLQTWQTPFKAVTAGIPLIPDAYFELATPSGIRAHFLEVDMGTESRSIWDRKVRHYINLARSGEFRRVFHQEQFRVLVLGPSDRRLANIRGAVLKHTERIFYFATFEDINRSGIWSPCWLRPTGDDRVSLL